MFHKHKFTIPKKYELALPVPSSMTSSDRMTTHYETKYSTLLLKELMCSCGKEKLI